MKSTRTAYLVGAGVALVTAAVFAGALAGGFVYDDSLLVLNHPLVSRMTLSHFLRIISFDGYSNYLPVRFISYSIDYSIWGLNPFGFHLTNLIIHLLSVFLVALLVHRMARRNGADSVTAAFSAGAASLLFGVHPLQVESVAWIAGRKDLLAVFFALSSFLCYFKSYSHPARKGSDFTLLASLLLFLAAALSKASVVAFPLLILASEWLLEPGPGQGTAKKRLERVLPFFIVGALVTAVDLLLSKQHNIINGLFGGSLFSHILTISKIPLLYLAKAFFPAHLTADYLTHIEHSLFSPIVLLSIVFWTGLVWLLARLAEKDKLLCWFAAWFIINLLPVMNIIPAQKLIADRYFYLSSVGLFGFVAVLLARTALKAGRRGVVAVCILFFIALSLLGYRTVRRVADWHSNFSLWQAAVAEEPDNPTSLSNLGFAYYEQGDYETSVSYFNKAIAVDPGNLHALMNLAGAQYKHLGKTRAAVDTLEKAVKSNPDSISPLMNLAAIYQSEEMFQEAYNAILRAMIIEPDNANLADMARYLRKEARKKQISLTIPPDIFQKLKKILGESDLK